MNHILRWAGWGIGGWLMLTLATLFYFGAGWDFMFFVTPFLVVGFLGVLLVIDLLRGKPVLMFPVGFVMLGLTGLILANAPAFSFIESFLTPALPLLALVITSLFYRHQFRDFLAEEAARAPAEREREELAKKRIQARSPSPKVAETPAEQVSYRYPAVRARYTFADIVGMASLKSRLLDAGKAIVNTRNGARSADTRNGVLLSGDPGNGKTMFAEALAGELKLPFINVTFGDIASMWVNQTTEQVAQVFHEARLQAPCVLFLDEIDSVLQDRSKVAWSESETTRITNTILTEVVALRDKGIVLIAATNLLDTLDPAAVREGRFDFKIEVPPPDFEARCAIFRHGFVKEVKRLPRGQSMPRLEDKVIEHAVARWDGFSAARIRAVAQETFGVVTAQRDMRVQQHYITEALRTVQGSAGKSLHAAKSLRELILSQEMQEHLTELAHRLTRIVDIEAMGGSVPSGVLFWGPAGTGKTVTAQALAKEARWAFLPTSGNDLLREPEAIDKLLRQASDLRPCVVFIDEADDVLANRSTSPYSASVTNKLLTALDGVGGKTKDVLFIAATNFPDDLDPAAVRGGRFTEKIEFTLPSDNHLATLVQTWWDGLKIPTDRTLQAPAIVEVLAGQSVANAQSVLQAAVNRAASRRLTSRDATLGMDDILVAHRKVVQD